MATQERKLRERQILKESIISAAKEIAQDSDWNGVTMRKIAEKIEYTPPVIYEHFKDKDELLQEIRKEGYQKLLAQYQQTLTDFSNPHQVLTQLGVAYLDFALENQVLYRAMYCTDRSALGITGLEKEIADIRLIIQKSLEKMMQNAAPHSTLNAAELADNIDILRCMLHGAISLFKIGALRDSQDEGRALAMKGIKDLVNCWVQK